MTILEEIAGHKRKEVEISKLLKDYNKLEKGKYFKTEPLLLTEFLLDNKKKGIIAEYKRKSPSSGIINEKARIEDVTVGYTSAGASGLSILTDNRYFGGTNDDLIKARELNTLPILRKDFTVDEYQIVESKSIGADVILLIAAILDKKQAKELARLAASLGMQVILEIHKIKELDYLNEYINIVGVNNRDLKNFTVDINISYNLSARIPAEFIKISESGIGSPGEIKKLRDYGYHGFLIGELFMENDDPVKSFEKFMNRL
jgi:indole-3-glycerol phosphate synthase